MERGKNIPREAFYVQDERGHIPSIASLPLLKVVSPGYTVGGEYVTRSSPSMAWVWLALACHRLLLVDSSIACSKNVMFIVTHDISCWCDAQHTDAEKRFFFMCLKCGQAAC